MLERITAVLIAVALLAGCGGGGENADRAQTKQKVVYHINYDDPDRQSAGVDQSVADGDREHDAKSVPLVQPIDLLLIFELRPVGAGGEKPEGVHRTSTRIGRFSDIDRLAAMPIRTGISPSRPVTVGWRSSRILPMNASSSATKER